MTREELERKVAGLLGGRAAEKAVFGHLSTGAADELARVTDIARSMVTRYGMDEALGYVTYDRDRPSFLGQPVPQGYAERGYSGETARRIDEAVRRIVDSVFDRTLAILERNRSIPDLCATTLHERETPNQDELPHLTR